MRVTNCFLSSINNADKRIYGTAVLFQNAAYVYANVVAVVPAFIFDFISESVFPDVFPKINLPN